MQRFVISLALAGAVFGAIVALGAPRDAQADAFGDTAAACAANTSACRERASEAYEVASEIFNFVDNTFLDSSYYEECIGEGCSTEEVAEDHNMYYEETIGEHGTFEEVTELAFDDGQRAAFDPAKQKAFILVMLRDFQKRGWTVRQSDVVAAGGW
jgi:hypothetical protein